MQTPTASFDGHAVAYVQDGNIWKRSTRGGHIEEGPCRFAATTKFTSMKWSSDDSQILATYDQGVHVVDSETLEERVWLKNGSGGLGRISDAEFIDNDHLLVISEFGKVKLWHMNSAKALDLPDVKTTCDGRAWGARPGIEMSGLFALLCRCGAEDNLILQFPSLALSRTPIKLPTSDVQSICWSPDGRWLAVLDVPVLKTNLHIYTPDGHLYRSYASSRHDGGDLGIKNITWSPDGRYLALSHHDGRIELLNTKTFSPVAVIEHNTTIDQSSLPQSDQAPVWLEVQSASGTKSYCLQTHPISPPLSKARPSTEPAELGVAEACFNSNGSYLATRDCRMLNTIWLWNMSTQAPHAVLIQHANVRSLSWHTHRPQTLLIDCAEGFAHLYDISSSAPPVAVPTGARPKARISWLNTRVDAKPVIMATEISNFHFTYPEGQDGNECGTPRPTVMKRKEEVFEEGGSEDSLFEVLSGRKPLPPKTAPSYTDIVDLDVEAEEATIGGSLDDTFREKRKAIEEKTLAEEIDPLDDSEIF